MEARRLWSNLEFGAAVATTSLALASFGLALSSPLYTDEIGWKLNQAHFIDDGWASRSATLVPSCAPDASTTPLILVPIRYLDSLVLSLLATPGDVRIYGFILFLSWFVVTWLMLRRLFKPIAPEETILAGIAGIVTLGVMPMLMVFSRPEQVLLLGITVFLIAAIDERPRVPASPSKDATVALAMAVGGAIMFASHPRAILALPIAILACLRVIERRTFSIAAAAVLTLFAVVAFSDFNARLDCPGDPNVQNILNYESIGMAASHHALGPYFERLGQVLRFQPGQFFYLQQFGFNRIYASALLPPYPYPVAGVLLTVLLVWFTGVVVVAGMIGFVLAAYTRIKRRQGLIALAALAFSWGIYLSALIARATRYNYEAELMEPLMALTSVLSIWLARGEFGALLGTARLARLARGGFGVLVSLSIASQVALLAGYLPYAATTWQGPGYVANQPLSVSTSGFPAIKEQILAAAARCGIEPDKNPQHLVLDDLTYFAFKHTRTPYLASYLSPAGWGSGIADLRGLLWSKGSDGAVIGCQWLYPALSTNAIRSGRFCCVPKF